MASSDKERKITNTAPVWLPDRRKHIIEGIFMVNSAFFFYLFRT